MDELIHYYSVDVSVTFDIDLDDDQIDTDLRSDIHDTFVEELQEAFKNNPDVDLDDYDWGWDKEHDYIQYLYISSILDKAAVTPVVEKLLDSIVSFERTDELWDGTYYYERHGLDTPPYERVANTRDYTYKVDVETDILRFFETDEDGEVLQEAVTKNELKDRAKKHRKKQKGITTLNPDAGNVEYNIGMFNKLSGATEGPSNNPVSGPFGGDVSAGDSGCCESIVKKRYHAPYPSNRQDIVREMKQPLNQKFRSLARNSRVTAEFYVLDGGNGLIDVCDKDDGSMIEAGFSTLENALKYCELCCGSSSTRARKSLLSDGIYVQTDYNLMNALKPMIESGVKLDPGYDGEAVFIYTESNPEQLIKTYHLSEFDVGNYNGDRVEYYGRSIKRDLDRNIDPRYLEPDTTTSYHDAVVAGHAFRREIADYAQSNDDADYRAGVYEHLDDVEKDEKIFMEEYDFTNVNTTYTKEVGMNDYFESMNKEDNE